MAKKKSGGKTRDRKPKGLARGQAIPMPNGGTLFAGAGNGPKKGAPNAGRPPDVWKQSLRALADRAEVQAHIDAALLAGPRRVVINPETGKEETVGSAFFEGALAYTTDHGYGRATQPVAHDVAPGLAELLTKMSSGSGGA